MSLTFFAPDQVVRPAGADKKKDYFVKYFLFIGVYRPYRC
jgi:hypothetical protein